MPAPAFSFTARLAPTSQIVCPLGIPAHGSPIPSNDVCKFELRLPTCRADWIEVKVFDRTDELLRTRLPSSFCEMGSHRWQWDGFDSQGTFDSRRLKRGQIQVEFSAGAQGATYRSELALAFTAARQDWVDVSIDRPRQRLRVYLRARLLSSRPIGVDELPPEPACRSSMFEQLPSEHPGKTASRCERPDHELQQLAAMGVARYWSGPVTMPDGKCFHLSSELESSCSSAMVPVRLVYNTNRKWLRSSNPGRIRCAYSLVGNVVPRRIVYNAGWIGYRNGWFYQPGSAADLAFEEAAAHELGHEILSAYGGGKYSYGHKGTSTLLTQTVKCFGKGGTNHPPDGPIDLMKYYLGARPKDFFQRVRASEYDLKSLLWLAGLRVRSTAVDTRKVDV